MIRLLIIIGFKLLVILLILINKIFNVKVIVLIILFKKLVK